MSAAMGALASSSPGSRAALRPHAIGTDLALKSGPGGGERIPRNFFVDMYGLRMLSQVIEPRESARTVTLEGTLAGMFPNMSRQMFTPSKTQVTRRVICAVKPLALFLLRRGRVTSFMFCLMVRTVAVSFRVAVCVFFSGDASLGVAVMGQIAAIMYTPRGILVHGGVDRICVLRIGGFLRIGTRRGGCSRLLHDAVLR